MPRIYDIVTKGQLKDWLDVGSDSADDFFESLAAIVTDVIETYTDKKFITRSFTEYYDGGGRNDLNLKYYPVYAIVSLNDDVDRSFAATDEIASTDYLLYNDQGIIKLFNDESKFTDALQNVKVIYKAGYSRFNVEDERNNYIDFCEAATAVGTLSAEITPGIYDAGDAAAQLATAFNGTGSLTFTVSYDFFDKAFMISAASSFTILWRTGSNYHKNCADLFGYERSANVSGVTSLNSQFVRSGLPEDVIFSAKKLVTRFKEEGAKGQGIQEVVRKVISHQGATWEYVKNELPDDVKMILDRYRRVFL